MTVADATVEGTLETVQKWIDRGYAICVPESAFCLVSTWQQLPEKSILEMPIPCRDGSFALLFMFHRKPLLDGGVSHPDKVRIVLAREILSANGRPTGVVHLEPFRASDEQVAEVLKRILKVARGEE